VQEPCTWRAESVQVRCQLHERQLVVVTWIAGDLN